MIDLDAAARNTLRIAERRMAAIKRELRDPERITRERFDEIAAELADIDHALQALRIPDEEQAA